MSTTLTLASIVGALAIGVMSPGPSFLMIARTAVGARRVDGLAAALGMGVGATLFAIAALIGLQALFVAVPTLYVALKVAGGAYLVFLGIRIWRGGTRSLALSEVAQERVPGSLARSFLLGLGTQISNPKTAVVYTSVFATFLPRDAPSIIAFAVPVAVFFVETGWYAIVAVALSASAPRSAYLRFRKWIDRAAGGVMVLLGVKLMTSVGEAGA
jgi:threonine efflux protein